MIKNPNLLLLVIFMIGLYPTKKVAAQSHIESVLSDDQESIINAISSLGMVDDQVSMAGDPIIQMDLNGNGLYDYVTAAHASGNVFVYFDLIDFNQPTLNPSTSSNLVISGAGGLGSSFASGDINGDGIDDLVMGAKSQGTEGEAYVIYGSTNIQVTGALNVISIANIRIGCSIDGGNDDIFGEQVACLDINGDGYDDIAIGASVVWYQGTGDGVGDVYVIYGGASMPSFIQARTNANIIITGSGAFDHIGKYVGKGNFNNDAYEDLVFSSAYWPGAGATGERGKVWILFGGQGLSSSYNTGVSSTSITGFEGPNQGDEMCYFEKGDINGDGIDDLLLSAGRYPSQFNSGIIYVVYGPIAPGGNYSATTWPNKTVIEPPTAYGNAVDAKFGQSMAVYDVNNDGYDDILAGGPGFSRGPLYYGTRPTEGAAWLIKGGSNLGAIYGGINQDLVYYANNQNQIIGGNYNISFGRSVNFIRSNNNKTYAAICDVERNKIYMFLYDTLAQLSLQKNCTPLLALNASQTQKPLVISGDFDNDGFKDFISSGYQGAVPKTTMYRNILGNSFAYSDISSINFPVWDIEAFDLENDGDLDLVLTGGATQGNFVTKIFSNLGGLNFIDAGLTIDGLGFSSLSCADFNNDGFKDLLVNGQTNSGALVTRVYQNNGGIGFSVLPGSITGCKNGDVKWGDFTGDGFTDFFICGETSSSKISELYINSGFGSFTINTGSVTPAQLRPLSNASAAWGDTDNDGDIDLLVSGYGRNPFKEYTKLYRNDGGGNFYDVYYNSYTNELTSGLILREVRFSAVDICDVNSDGKNDIIAIGTAGYYPYSKPFNSVIHLNNGYGKFKDLEPFSLDQIRHAAICTDDFDNDGDQDLVVFGEKSNGLSAEMIINKRNNGTACFSIGTPSQIAQVSIASNVTFPACQGTSVTFTATPTNGGAAPTYQWYKNGSPVGTNNPTFTTNILSNGDLIKCVMTSSLAGILNNPATSNFVTVSVGTLSNPIVNITGSTTYCSGSNTCTLSTSFMSGYTYQWIKGSSTLVSGATSNSYVPNATSSNTYKVRITDSNGCSSTSNPTAITILPLPLSTATASGPTSFCSGQNLCTINANIGTGYSYQWYKGVNLVSGATNLSYVPTSSSNFWKVRVTSPNGCTKFSNNVAVTVWPLPTATATASGTTNVCVGDSALLVANSGTAFSYQWQRYGTNILNATNISLKAFQTGNYRVRVTNANGCTKLSSNVSVNVSSSFCKEVHGDGLGEIEFLFENPNTGHFLIESPSSFPDGKKFIITIYDGLGKCVYNEVSAVIGSHFSHWISLNENIPRGLYHMKITENNSSYNFKLILK